MNKSEDITDAWLPGSFSGGVVGLATRLGSVVGFLGAKPKFPR